MLEMYSVLDLNFFDNAIKPILYCYGIIERFHSRGQPHANLLKQKEVYIRKEFNSQRIGLEHQHGHRFIVLEHQYGCRDVM